MTNEYENTDGVATAATEMINGHEYAVLNVYSDTAYDTIGNFVSHNVYSKIVLQADYGRTGKIHFNNSMSQGTCILDLNGYTLSSDNSDSVNFRTTYAEIWDSSVAKTGKISCSYIWVCSSISTVTELTVYGGTLAQVHMDNMYGGDITLTIYDGNLSRGINYNIRSGINYRLNVYGGTVSGRVYIGGVEGYVVTKPLNASIAPWVDVTYNESGNIAAINTPDYFAVSTTDLAAGVYNYAYGYRWEINVAELQKLTIPTGKTYYLWGRNDGEWYQYLNVRYVDGGWVAA